MNTDKLSPLERRRIAKRAVAKISQAAEAHAAAEREYFRRNGWPVNIDGTLKTATSLDIGELRAIAMQHAITLQTEFNSITTRAKELELAGQ